MLLDNHFEDLTFPEDSLINTSHTVARSYTNLVHWHPFAEILLSLTEGNEVELNFRKYEMNPNDFIISYPGDLHTIRNVSMNSFLLVQFPFELITVVPEFSRIRQLMERSPFCRYDVGDTQIGKMVLTIKKIVNSTKDVTSFWEIYRHASAMSFDDL
ncbi:MAG: AraC family ligand binding domain-containing protein [Lachnospiraceae bacterium]|nr:AraC family ligand binding domain-containing protein [Lachnospiraceae bacterium]